MKKKLTSRLLLFVVGLCLQVSIFGQNGKFTISGQIKDASNGEDIPFATITLLSKSGVGTTSNVYGFYSLSLDPGEYRVSYRLQYFLQTESSRYSFQNCGCSRIFYQSAKGGQRRIRPQRRSKQEQGIPERRLSKQGLQFSLYQESKIGTGASVVHRPYGCSDHRHGSEEP